MRRTTAFAAMILVVAPQAACADPVLHKDAQGCRMIVPTDLGQGASRWIGACTHGAATGAGVLRVDRGHGDVALFAGTMQNGRPVAGYLDTGSAETAGPSLHFNGPSGLPASSRGEAQRACTIASAGAKAASDRLRQAGNTASATFYGRWSRTLRQCMDRAE